MVYAKVGCFEMIFFKLYWHVSAFLHKLFFKLIYFRELETGENVTFRKRFTLLIDKRAKVHIGDRVFFNNYCSVVSLNNIYIGDDCIFGEGVKIYDHNHRFNMINRKKAEQGFKSSPIIIEKNCWIANDVMILKGVTIGENSVIGAGCVISKDIPANTVVTNAEKTNISALSYQVIA